MSIRFDHLFYTYQANSPFASAALEDINLDINERDFLAIIGHTGSGKSTLAQQINALLRPTKGKVVVGKIASLEDQQNLEKFLDGYFSLVINDEISYFENYIENKLENIIFKKIINGKLFYIAINIKSLKIQGYLYDEKYFTKREKKSNDFLNITTNTSQNDDISIFVNNSISLVKELYASKEGKALVYCVDAKDKKTKGIKALKKYAGLVFQFPEYQLFEETILDDVSFGPKNFGLSEEESVIRAKEALKLVGIDEDLYNRSPFELSGGQKRRVAIAGIIALEPKILVLDEPTAGLDPKGAKEMMALFRQIYEKGTNIIIITHDMDLVLEYATRAIVMSKGKIISDCTPIELFAKNNLNQYYNLHEPQVLSFAKDLIKGGLNIELDKIKNLDTLLDEIRRVKNG